MPQNLFSKKFEEEYQRLNPEQKKAVDTIEGPVMVIAGAGTGKTQTIALRIANIILKTQTPPQNILCLTFTETGAIAMRQRLLAIIGPAAYYVRIHTFHSFCNEIIQNNPEYFIFAKDIKNLEEVERIEILENLIEALPDSSLLKPWGDHLYYLNEVGNAIQTLKRENITPEKLLSLVNDQQKFVDSTTDIYKSLKSFRASKNLESEVLSLFEKIPNFSPPLSSLFNYNLALYRQDGFVIGAAKSPTVNFKNALLKIFDNLTKNTLKQKELYNLFLAYEKELKTRGRYDYEDMILFVLNAFKNDQDLLLSYQEKFQYILVDEYQDTNSAQNQIIDYLGSYFDSPNLFVVGDDDQSIFRFQGAAIENIFDFYQKYKSLLTLVVLKNNYRSHQLILDSSTSVIENNKNRIANFIKNVDKSLTSSVTHDPDPINLFIANSPLEENYLVVQKIKELIKEGTSPKDIAVLYRNNADIADLIEMFSSFNLKYRLLAGTNVLENLKIHQLLSLLSYINNPADDQLLFKILSFDFININSFDLLKILKVPKVSFSDLIFNRQKLKKAVPDLKSSTLIKLKNFKIRLSKSRKWLENYTFDKFFNRVIRRFGYLRFILAQNDIYLVNDLNTLYVQIKKYSGPASAELNEFLARITRLTDNHLPLNSGEISLDTPDSINLMTVHRSKGLEFNHVFLIKCVDKKWGNSQRYSPLPLPFGILKTELSLALADENEEERRLFYVALTRAKKQIYISYSSRTDSNRDQVPSLFVSEIRPELIEKVPIPVDYQKQALTSVFFKKDMSQITTNTNQIIYLKDYLKNRYKFNITHLNSYLRCPFCFYHKTILRIPAAKDKFASLGTAVHNSLSYLFNTLKYNNVLISKDDFLAAYKKNLLKEGLTPKDFQESLNRGSQSLSSYYDFYKDSFSGNCLLDYDFKDHNVFLANIPITGKIDKIEINDNQNANVVDFKTGNPDTKFKELSKEGDYFRQLVFYKILAAHDPQFKFKVKNGTIDFIQKSKRINAFIKRKFEITIEDEKNLRTLINDVYQKILNLDFNHLGKDCRDDQGLHDLYRVSSV